ncbi:hypothetical protein FRX31_029515 [Thalictrum thalictroides]|uniref:Uncharacterized protein n=1 Tax=Thalictrum thalictroides TaxID=46969 RepID=A0A7J6V888_THATH|nr:hypothetical protein FRX31_029515 [Thalictrum thalictroides]
MVGNGGPVRSANRFEVLNAIPQIDEVTREVDGDLLMEPIVVVESDALLIPTSKSVSGPRPESEMPRTILARPNVQSIDGMGIDAPSSSTNSDQRTGVLQNDGGFAALSSDDRRDLADSLLNCRNDDNLVNLITYMVIPTSKELGMSTTMLHK